MKTKSALSYFGSDSEVAAELASMLDHCSHVTVPLVGGAAILPHLRARSIVANDKNEYAIDFYRAVSGCFGEQTQRDLIECCKSTLSHPAEVEKAKDRLESLLAIDRAGVEWTEPDDGEAIREPYAMAE